MYSDLFGIHINILTNKDKDLERIFQKTNNHKRMIRFVENRYYVQRRLKGKKVKLSLSLTKHHIRNTYWGSGGIAPLIP